MDRRTAAWARGARPALQTSCRAMTGMLSDDTCCIWNAHNHEAFAAAQRQRTTVKVTCCLAGKGRPTDMILYGCLCSVTGREAVLVVQDREILPRRSRMQANTCEFFFCLDTKKEGVVVERLGYRGAGRVMGVKKNAREEISQIYLRLCNRCFVRPMRRDKRVMWRSQYCRASGVLRLLHMPQLACDLKTLLHRHNHRAADTQILNISARGACALMPLEADLKKFSDKPDLLFYMVPNSRSRADTPYIFLGKKVGFLPAAHTEHLAVRMHFVYELDWDGSERLLRWSDISPCGSARLREHLDHYDDNTANEQWFAI